MKRKLVIIAVALLLAGWLAYFALGHPVAGLIAQHWGQKLVQAGDGKFQDPAFFLQRRFLEFLELLSFTAVLVFGLIVIGNRLAKRFSRRWQWVPWSGVAFVGLNLWLVFAATTCLFWCVFWNGKGKTDNYTQFHIKLLLMDENRAPMKLVLGGSSQVHAEIDPRILNEELGPDKYTTELHFPGNKAYDFLSLDRKLANHQADVIVCYLSELNFFGEGYSAGFPLFLRLGDLPTFFRLGGKVGWGPRPFWYGVLGNLLPVFHLRDAIAQRCLGERLLKVEEEVEVSGQSTDLKQRALETAPWSTSGPQSRFQMAAFEEFVSRCQAKQRTVVLCCGQYNPLLGNALKPELRAEMIAYLRRLASQHPNVVLLEDNQLPKQTPEDYVDLTHVNRAAQVQYSHAVVAILRGISKRP